MQAVLQELFRMFYPLSNVEKRKWAPILSGPGAECEE
jgi:hypothetical protein